MSLTRKKRRHLGSLSNYNSWKYRHPEINQSQPFKLSPPCNKSITTLENPRYFTSNQSQPLAPLSSDPIKTNQLFLPSRVITGVRFVKDKQIIHIQIQEGLLEPQGIVNKSSVEWKPIDSYSVRDDHVKNGIDYHTMTYINRAIDLDDNIAPPSYALTGKSH